MNSTGNGKKKKGELPEVNTMDTVSPATRLLEKRRLMYENQEQFMNKKKEFQQAEIGFKANEKQLRDRDNEIQEQIIKFATYLDTNQKAMRKCDDNIQKIDEECKEKDEEIRKKKFWYQILKDKEARISKQKQSVEQYQIFLERVKEDNRDEYSEVKKIKERYDTLESSHIKLAAQFTAMEEELNSRQKQVASYEVEMNTSIMKLNNKIANRTKQHDELIYRLQQLRNDEQDAGARQREKKRLFSRVIMAVDSLESACLNRKDRVPDLDPSQKRSYLKYEGKNYMNIIDENVKNRPGNFDEEQHSFEYALLQLDAIQQYLRDFNEIREKLTKYSQEKMYGSGKALAEELS